MVAICTSSNTYIYFSHCNAHVYLLLYYKKVGVGLLEILRVVYMRGTLKFIEHKGINTPITKYVWFLSYIVLVTKKY